MKKDQLWITALIPIARIITAAILISLSGCGSASKHNISGENSSTAALSSKHNSGGYYLDDGPDINPPTNLDSIPDAIPKIESLRKANMRPYVALGNTYRPLTKLSPYKKRGIATWYGRRYHGKKTAIGEIYDMYAMTAAHPTLPLPSYARVTNVKNGKSIVVRINDRGPFLSNRIIDLSYTAAHKLDVIAKGSAKVEVESIIPGPSRPIAKSLQEPTAFQSKSASPNAETIYLQLGAFGTVGNANNFLSNMQAELPWLVETLGIAERDGLFRIKAGPFPNLLLAEYTANEISQRVAIKPMLLIE
jgi:peptidoglycan lytic transglycosylase